MRLLLDTHIWVWSFLEPHRLSRRVATELSSKANELWLSPISVWELLVAARKGRIRLEPDPESWVLAAIDRAPLKEAPITQSVALETHRIKLPHRDPADAFLAATARVFELTLVTADERLIHAKAAPVLANRLG